MQIFKVSDNFTRPDNTTGYINTDLVANSATAGSVTPLAFKIPYGRGAKIWRADLLKTSTTKTNATFNLHLYLDSPTCTNGDNDTWLTTASGYIGAIALDLSNDTFSDDNQCSGVYVNNSVFAPLMIYTDTDYTVYGLLEATAAYSPAAEETFTVTLIGEAYS